MSAWRACHPMIKFKLLLLVQTVNIEMEMGGYTCLAKAAPLPYWQKCVNDKHILTLTMNFYTRY